MLRPSIALFPIPVEPSLHIPRLIDADVREPDFAEQLRHPCRALALGPGGRRDRRERRLASERQLVGALDVMARGADAIVGEEP